MKTSIKISIFLLVVVTGGCFTPLYALALSDDDFEPNDDFNSAVSITTGVHNGLTLSETDLYDWYKIEVPKNMAIKAKMEVITESPSNNFYLLYLYLDENKIVASDVIFSNSENEGLIGEVAYINQFSTQQIYIACLFNPLYYTAHAEYTLTIEIYDPKSDAVFNYGIDTGDVLVFAESNNIDITASPQFYNEIGALYIDKIESEANESVFSNNFNFSNFVDKLMEQISLNFYAQFSISEIFNLDLYSDDNMSTDIIEGSVLLGNDGNFMLPSEFAADQMEDFKTTFEPYFDSNFFNDNIEPIIDDALNELNNETAEDFQNLFLSSHRYFDNLTDALYLSVDPLDNGTTFPALPNNHYVPFNSLINPTGFFNIFALFNLVSSTPICYPTDFSYVEWYNWGLDAFDFAKAYADQENEDVEAFAYSFQQLMNIGGISSFHVDKQSISFVWDLNGVDFDKIDDLMNYTEGDLENDLENDFDEALAEAGIDYDNSEASFSIAIEYDSDMVLASVAVYGDLTLTFSNENFLDIAIDGETVKIAVSQTIVREGYRPPTAEQIQDGKIGEDRNLKGRFSFANIPGASIELLGIFSLLSLVALAIFIKRRKILRIRDVKCLKP